MAEKSTFLRQNALIAILAHMDSFVPADSAHIGVNDKIFSRVGATDNITAGYSTFMVEMIETATIVNQATDRSLVILDEIGRGTGVYDGLSIAQAVIEHIHNVNKCRAISATHYTKVSKYLKSVKCFCVRIKEWKEEVIFLHEVVEGVADESYGTLDASTHREALLLLKESSNDLIYKHKVMKQAFSSSADNRSFSQSKLNIENYLLKKKKKKKKKKIKLMWKTNELLCEV
ncbi:DNA mismatch repair protein mutS, putative [Brugia malayi]|uniref:DNA mismatch repair protein mutS, putative n=1 Tax=Brugia malayi TaxID=6279 RepID=A0A4E9FSQ5_BRUMA|nr:DNA mismatch repair protein mutS, putative [Brugia malayi]VIP00013.1 DNA mismatch repair protein mutS, putative [Brugia malayi]